MILVTVQSVEWISHVERISVEIRILQLYSSVDSVAADSDSDNLDHAGVSFRQAGRAEGHCRDLEQNAACVFCRACPLPVDTPSSARGSFRGPLECDSLESCQRKFFLYYNLSHSTASQFRNRQQLGSNLIQQAAT